MAEADKELARVLIRVLLLGLFGFVWLVVVFFFKEAERGKKNPHLF